MPIAARFAALSIVILGVLACFAPTARAQERRAAPSFKTGAKDTSQDWINTDRAITLGDLKGKVVLLDFWTFG